jgi:hypothetical protein
MLSVKGIIDKVTSRKLAVTAAAGAAAATGVVEITLPVAIVAAAYIIGQALVDAWPMRRGRGEREAGRL